MTTSYAISYQSVQHIRSFFPSNILGAFRLQPRPHISPHHLTRSFGNPNPSSSFSRTLYHHPCRSWCHFSILGVEACMRTREYVLVGLLFLCWNVAFPAAVTLKLYMREGKWYRSVKLYHGFGWLVGHCWDERDVMHKGSETAGTSWQGELQSRHLPSPFFFFSFSYLLLLLRKSSCVSALLEGIVPVDVSRIVRITGEGRKWWGGKRRTRRGRWRALISAANSVTPHLVSITMAWVYGRLIFRIRMYARCRVELRVGIHLWFRCALWCFTSVDVSMYRR